MTDPRIWVSPGSGAPGSAGRRPEPATPSPPAEPERETEIPLRPLGVSEILDGAITCVRRSPRATLGLSAILVSGVQVIVAAVRILVVGPRFAGGGGAATVFRALGPSYVVQVIGALLMTYVVWILAGLLAPVTGRMLLGRTTSPALARSLARVRLRRVVGTATAMLGAMLAAVAVPLVPFFLAAAVGAPTGVVAVTLLFGMPVAVALFVSSRVWFAVATPVAALEGRGAFAALRRSAEVMRGRWWRAFGVLVLAWAISLFVGALVLQLPFSVAQGAILAVDKEPAGWVFVALVAIGALGGIVSGTLTAPFEAGVLGLLYADRRMRREAFDLELALEPPDDPVAAWLPGPLTAAGSGRQPKIRRPPTVMPPPGWRR